MKSGILLRTIPFAAVLAFISAPLAANNFDRGEALYENHCQVCHENTIHERTEPRVTSLESLRAWVMSWSIHSDLKWNEEDFDDVSHYLNSRFYQLQE